MPSTLPDPLISVVMPTLNQAAFIGQALDSVYSQGLPGLEVVVADGGSTDGTQALLAQRAAAHPGQLHWTSQPDDGPAAAVNHAVARARGAVIGWLNSDDLYTPGAIGRALAHLQQHPQHVMVYGEGDHIDAQGGVLNGYPTRTPDLPLAAWADGCPICQPTAFFRRDAFLALAGLDTTLRTAFDYEFWLRLVKAHPGGVAHLPQVQAQSRLHAGGITLRLRQQVALEALQVIHRHIGPAPAHWLLTHFAEVMAGLPFDAAREAPAVRLMRLVDTAQAWLSPEAQAHLRQYVATHGVLRMARAHWFADAHPDGWAPPLLHLRLRQAAPPWRVLRLGGRHASPAGGLLHLQASRPGTAARSLAVSQPGPFVWNLPLEDLPADSLTTWTVVCDTPFVPAQVEPGSDDQRELAFVLESVDFVS